MNQVKLNKVPRDDLKALQLGIKNYIVVLQADLKPQMTLQFFDNMQQLGLATKIFKTFRNKLETKRAVYTITLADYEAITLLYSCANTECIFPNVCHDKSVAGKFKNIIDQQLKSLNIWIIPPQTLSLDYQQSLPESDTAIT